jgi:Ca2+-binding RTX toxin-like protein
MAVTVNPTTGGSGVFEWVDGLGPIDLIGLNPTDSWQITLTSASTLDIRLKDAGLLDGAEFTLTIDGNPVAWSSTGTVDGHFQGTLNDYLLGTGTHTVRAVVTKLDKIQIPFVGSIPSLVGIGEYSFSDIRAVNAPPVIANKSLVPNLGSCDLGAILGPDDLKATDANGDPLTYTITKMSDGAILVHGVLADEGTTFTQADIDAGYVQLLGGDISSTTLTDSFDFTVSDGMASVGGTFKAAYGPFDTVQKAPLYGGYWGGNGNDFLRGSDAADNMSGGNGCDLMVGGKGNDQMNGQEGNNKLFGGSGNDMLTGGNGNDLLDGGDNADQLHANGGNNIVFGGNGSDTITAGEGNDLVWGGCCADTIHVNGGNNRVDAGEGNDTVTAGNGNDTIILGTGDDVVFANGGINKFQLGGLAGAASDGNDQYTGGNGADKYALFLHDRGGNGAGWGNDTINGFRISEGDQLVAFNQKGGFWDDDSDLANLIASDFVNASRGTGGDAGDLKLVLGSGATQSSLTLKWFFWDNGSFGTTIGNAAVSDSQLLSILKAAVQDGATVGASGADYLVKGQNWISHDFMFA